MTHNIISVEEFKNRAFNVIPIPGFKEGDEPIFVQIRATGVMSLIANGKIPNTLLGKVTELFGGGEKVEKDNATVSGITEEQKQAALAKLSKTDTGIADMAELLQVFASASLVQPKYEDIKDYMTDEQLMAIFSAMYGEVQNAESFRSNKGNE